MTDEHSKEEEMRDSKVPSFDTMEELETYIEALRDQEHDYGTCVYAMSMAATATFNYMARALGCTGFQASCADLDVIRRTRLMDGPFRIIDYSNLLYPQYHNKENFPTINNLIEDNIEWLAKEAQKKLDSTPNAHPDVIEHWQWLVNKGKIANDSSTTD